MSRAVSQSRGLSPASLRGLRPRVESPSLGCNPRSALPIVDLPSQIIIRLMDLLVAIPGVVLTAFVFLCIGCEQFSGRPRVGKNGVTFREWSWSNGSHSRGRLLQRLHLAHLPRMWNLLVGQMTLVGPQLNFSPRTFRQEQELLFCRRISPGLLSLFGLRRLANIDFTGELETEIEFVCSYSLGSVAGVLFRFLVALFYGRSRQVTQKRVNILGLRIDNLRMSEALDWIANQIRLNLPGAQVSFVNAHCANIANKDTKYMRILGESALVLADGIGMKLAGSLLERPVAQNVNGTDMLPLLCSRLEQINGSIYLLGGEPGVAPKVASWITTHFPKVRIAGARSGFFPEGQTTQELEAICAAKTDVLLVAMGVPRQEYWIAEHLPATGACVALGVGGLFDFYSGRIPRAPQWLREVGLEWTYRLYQEPGRMWHRYIVGNLAFLFRVVKVRFHSVGPLQEVR